MWKTKPTPGVVSAVPSLNEVSGCRKTARLQCETVHNVIILWPLPWIKRKISEKLLLLDKLCKCQILSCFPGKIPLHSVQNPHPIILIHTLQITSTVLSGGIDLLKAIKALELSCSAVNMKQCLYVYGRKAALLLHLFFPLSFHYNSYSNEPCKCQPNQQSCWMSTVHHCLMQPLRPIEKAVIVYKIGQRISSHMDSRPTWASLKRYTSFCQQELLGETITYPLVLLLCCCC